MSAFRKINYIINASPLDKLETKLLIRCVTNLSQVDLITKTDFILTEVEYNTLQSLIKRRQNGEPINYILGYKEFYSRNFKVTNDTLIPRPETELLVDRILELVRNNAAILELGTGTGCIAITCKLENLSLKITATDKYPDTLAVATHNAKTLNAQINFILSDWFSDIDGKFDIIVSNPPYIASDDKHLNELTHEPIHALTDGRDGYQHLQTIIKNAINYLNSHGYLLLEHGYNQGEKVKKMFIEYGYVDVMIINDYAGLPRITSGKIN